MVPNAYLDGFSSIPVSGNVVSYSSFLVVSVLRHGRKLCYQTWRARDDLRKRLRERHRGLSDATTTYRTMLMNLAHRHKGLSFPNHCQNFASNLRELN